MSFFPVPGYKSFVIGASGITSIVATLASNNVRYGKPPYTGLNVPKSLLAAALLQFILIVVLILRSWSKMYRKVFHGSIANMVVAVHALLPDFIISFQWLLQISLASSSTLLSEKANANGWLTLAAVASNVFSASVLVILFVPTAAFDKTAMKFIAKYKMQQKLAAEEDEC